MKSNTDLYSSNSKSPYWHQFTIMLWSLITLGTSGSSNIIVISCPEIDVNPRVGTSTPWSSLDIFIKVFPHRTAGTPISASENLIVGWTLSLLEEARNHTAHCRRCQSWELRPSELTSAGLSRITIPQPLSPLLSSQSESESAAESSVPAGWRVADQSVAEKRPVATCKAPSAQRIRGSP